MVGTWSPSSGVLSFRPLLAPWSHARWPQGSGQPCPRARWAALHAQGLHRAFAANSPPEALFTCPGAQPSLLSILRSTGGVHGHAGSRRHPLPDGMGSGIQILGSPGDSEAGGPLPDIPVSTLPPMKISLLSPRLSWHHVSKRPSHSGDSHLVLWTFDYCFSDTKMWTPWRQAPHLALLVTELPALGMMEVGGRMNKWNVKVSQKILAFPPPTNVLSMLTSLLYFCIRNREQNCI